MMERKELTKGLLEVPQERSRVNKDVESLAILRDVIQIALGLVTVVLTIVNFMFGVGIKCRADFLAGSLSFVLTNLVFVLIGTYHMANRLSRNLQKRQADSILYLCSIQLLLSCASFAVTAGNFGLHLSNQEYLSILWITSFVLNFGVPCLGVIALYIIIGDAEPVCDHEERSEVQIV